MAERRKWAKSDPKEESGIKKAVGYIRVSTEQQAGEDKNGIEGQKREIQAYAGRNGYEIVQWLTDVISGVKDDRPEFNRLLYGDEFVNSQIEAVISFKTDRVARDTKLYFYYMFVLEKKNIKLLSTQETFPEGSEFANIYRSLMLFAAEQERKNIALRTSTGRGVKASMGGYSGGRPPYGYKAVDRKLQIDESEAPVVRRIFKLYDAGENYLHIADILNDDGIKTRTGKRFQDKSVSAIVGNRKLYQGYYQYGGGQDKVNAKWVKGVHEPILEE